MKRWTYCYRVVDGDPADAGRRVRNDLPALIAAAVGGSLPEPSGDGSHLITLSARLLGTTIAKTVRVRVGVATHESERLVIPLSWRADPFEHAFPTFEGTVEVEALSEGAAQLSIVGCYTPPAGPLGAMLDHVGLGGVGDRAIEGITDGIARALTKPLPPVVTLDPGPMRVRDVMHPDPITLQDDDQLRAAALLLFHQRISGAPVLDDRGALVGVLSEADLLEKEATAASGFMSKGAAHGYRLRSARTVGEACSRPARVTAPDTALHDAAREMLRHDIARLVVVDSARVVGIVTRHDVLRSLIRGDAVIRSDVRRVLIAMDEPAVTAAVDWGTVTLTGDVSRLSVLGALLDRVGGVDGVLTVDSDAMRWTMDDVTYVPMM